MPSFHPKNILCPVDMSPLSDLALKYAHAGARVFKASLTVLHAVHAEYPRYLSEEFTSRVLKELKTASAVARQQTMEHVQRVLAGAESKVPIRYETADLEPTEAVMQALSADRTELVVMGTHGYSGLKHWMLGSVTESVLHQAKVPVFAVRQKIHDFIDPAQPGADPRIRHILCPCNLTLAAGRALQVAAALADRFNARLTALRVRETGAAEDGRDLPAWIRETGGSPEIDCVERKGEAALQIFDLAKSLNADLIVIGAYHRPFEQGTLVGRTTELVLRHAGVPVLSVPYRDDAE